MSFFGWMRRGWTRRRFLSEECRKTAEQLAETPLAQAAPVIADAIGNLHEVVTASAHEAVAAAHDSLAPVCREAIEASQRKIQTQNLDYTERVKQLASRCRDEVERAYEKQEEQAEQLRALRELYAANQEQVARFQEGYDWQVIKEYCFRFIRILDSMEEKLVALRGVAPADHVRDVEDSYHEIQFALEASGVEQFRPEPRTKFAGQEKTLQVVGTVTADDSDDHGLVASVRLPGYRLVREGQVDRNLRPAHVVVFAEARHETQLQETQT